VRIHTFAWCSFFAGRFLFSGILIAMPTHTGDRLRIKSYDVFVSYKREDDAAREVLVTDVKAARCEVFWDGKLNQDNWKSELRDEINRSKMVICLWSAKAADSEYVKADAYHAFGLGKLLSAHIEDASVVPEYLKDAHLHPFDGWADEVRGQGQVENILGTFERITGGPSLDPEPRAAVAESSLRPISAPSPVNRTSSSTAGPSSRVAWESSFRLFAPLAGSNA
jgi:TIR domain-containing protein